MNYFQEILNADGLLKCYVCNEGRRFSSVQELGQLPKNQTLISLKNAEHHRLGQLGLCQLCNKKMAFARCYHCRSLACFKCMTDHEQSLAIEQAKENEEIQKIREDLIRKIDRWDENLNESKESLRQAISSDAERKIKEIQGETNRNFYFSH